MYLIPSRGDYIRDMKITNIIIMVMIFIGLGLGSIPAAASSHSGGFKATAFNLDPFATQPYESAPYWSFPYDSQPYWSFPYWSFDQSAQPYWSFPYWSFDQSAQPYWSFPYWSFDQAAQPYWSFPFWSFDQAAQPFWSFPYWSFDQAAQPYWSFPYWSFDQSAQPFWSFDQAAQPFWSFPFWSFPFWSFDQSAQPFWSFEGYDLQPFWSFVMKLLPFWSFLNYSGSNLTADPFWSFFETLPFWSFDQGAFVDHDGNVLHAKDIKNLFKSIKHDWKKFKHENKSDWKEYKHARKDAKKAIKKYKHYIKKMFRQYRKFMRHFNPEIPWNINAMFGNKYVGNKIDTSDIQVAVLDSGIDLSHPDLANKVVWSVDTTGTGIGDESGHGTHVAGTIAAEYNGFGVAGVAPNTELYSIKVVTGQNMEGEWPWLRDAIYLALQGPDGVIGTDDDADVINMSFGSNDEVPPEYIHDAIQYAYDLGVVMVAAGGNSGDGDASTYEMNYPAAYPEVIAVGSLDYDGTVSDFSNSGDYIEFVAPGNPILSTFLNGTYRYWGGTSMSTPHISGLVAILMAMYGHLPIGTFGDDDDTTIRGLLHLLSTDLGPEGWDPEYGYGIPQY